jgi:hypothetical protein
VLSNDADLSVLGVLQARLPAALVGGRLAVDVPTGASGLTNTELRATPVPVSGTVTANAGTGPFPISDNGGSLTVDGTFWQATQPVSAASLPLPAGAATDGAPVSGQTLEAGGSALMGWLSSVRKAITDRLPAALVGGRLDMNIGAVAVTVPVSGTFWQATQPVSGTVTANAGTGPFPVSDNGGSITVDGTFWQATQPVSGTVTSNLGTIAGVATEVTLAARLPTPVAKGTQGATGMPTQALKDSGRQHISLNWEEMAGTAAAESALTNFTSGSRGGTALSAANQYTVQAGKTLRIHTVCIYVKATSTINNLARFRIRQAASVANSSPIIFDYVMSLESPTVAANEAEALAIPLPEGIEVAAGQQITFTWFTAATTCTVGMNILAFEY